MMARHEQTECNKYKQNKTKIVLHSLELRVVVVVAVQTGQYMMIVVITPSCKLNSI